MSASKPQGHREAVSPVTWCRLIERQGYFEASTASYTPPATGTRNAAHPWLYELLHIRMATG